MPNLFAWAFQGGLCLLLAAQGSGWVQAQTARGAWPANAVVQLIAVGPAGYGRSQECSATALLLDSQGDLLTNAHVVARARRCLDGQAGGRLLARPYGSSRLAAKAVPCQLVALDERRDLALLRADLPFPLKPLSRLQFKERRLPAGTRLEVAGFPAASWQPVVQSGSVVGYQDERLISRSRKMTQMMVVEASLRPGSSGSPVYLAEGKLVGMAEARLLHEPDKALVIPARYITRFLASHHVLLGSRGRHDKPGSTGSRFP